MRVVVLGDAVLPDGLAMAQIAGLSEFDPVQWGITTSPKRKSSCTSPLPRDLGTISTQALLGGVDLMDYSNGSRAMDLSNNSRRRYSRLSSDGSEYDSANGPDPNNAEAGTAERDAAAAVITASEQRVSMEGLLVMKDERTRVNEVRLLGSVTQSSLLQRRREGGTGGGLRITPVLP